MSQPKDSVTTREEIIKELERSILVTKDNEGDYHVDIGDGAIVFTIYQKLKGDPDAGI